MHFRSFYVGCLAHASYLVGDGDEAAVIDPARDVEPYLEEAEAHGLAIRWVLETHLHADFVSGHLELAARTGAAIALGARAEAGFPHRALGDGDTLALGGIRIRALETPGHTPESLTFLVYERPDDVQPWGAFTGDTLFVGDVGRVDILSTRLPVGELAGALHDSLQRLLRLPDATRVYPAHGAGSLCGRGIGAESWSTIGRERLMNPALRPMSREAFVADVTRDVPETPVYFLHSRDLNRLGPPLRASVTLPPVLGTAELAAALSRGAVVLDARSDEAYAAAHPEGAVHVALDGQYASWVGTVLRPGDELLVLAPPERAEEATVRLARVGYERVAGLVPDAPEAWRAAGLGTATTGWEPAPLAVRGGRRVLDVRRRPEWETARLEGAVHVPLAALADALPALDRDADWAVVCAGGYRSAIAASLLGRAGFRRVTIAAGGIDALRAASLPLLAGT